MTCYGKKIDDRMMATIGSYMDDDIREDLHLEIAPCSNEEFIRAYLERDPEFVELMENEFEFKEDREIIFEADGIVVYAEGGKLYEEDDSNTFVFEDTEENRVSCIEDAKRTLEEWKR